MIFISYKSEEKKHAEDIKSVLEKNGIQCWMAPDSITPGEDFGAEIVNAISNCDAFVLVLSQKSQESIWIRHELDTAIGARKIIIPFHIDDSVIGNEFNFRISSMQRIEAYNKMAQSYQILVDRLLRVTSASGGAETESDFSPKDPRLARVELLIENSDYKKASEVIERVLDDNPTDSRVYVLSTLIDLHLKSEDCLNDCDEELLTNNNFKLAIKYARGEYKNSLEKYLKNAEDKFRELNNRIFDQFDFSFDGDSATIVKCKDIQSRDLCIPKTILVDSKKYTVNTIGESAFENCQSVDSIHLPEGIKRIERSAFVFCSSLKSINIPDTVKSIGVFAFGYCKSLTKIVIPNNDLRIEDFAFTGCESLKEIAIPEGVSSIGKNPFSECHSLEKIIVDSNNEKYESRNNCNAVIEKSTNTLIVGCQKTVIPEYVEHIGCHSFHGNKNLREVTIPNSVLTIDYSAFERCTSLHTVTIYSEDHYPSISQLSVIGEAAFGYCTSLVNIGEITVSVFGGKDGDCEYVFPYSLTTIEKQAFQGCSSLTTVKLGLNVVKLGDDVFKECKSLEIYKESFSKPEGWSNYWNPDGRPVMWA